MGQLLSRKTPQNQSQDSTELVKQQFSRPLLYRLLFREVLSVDKAAGRAEAASQPSGTLRNYHLTRLELSPTQDAQLKAIAAQCIASLAPVDARANAIIEAAKKRHRGAPKGSPNAQVPPAPPELAALEMQRSSIILSAVDALAQMYGPGEFVYFENLVRRHMSASVKLIEPVKLNR